MDVQRIGEKFVSKQKILETIDEILRQRVLGLSQIQVAKNLGVERSLISRLENMGEIRRGRSIAVIGFPIKNKEEVERFLDGQGVGYKLILTEEERWSLIKGKGGPELLNFVMEQLKVLRDFDVVIAIGSNQRVKILRGLLDKEVVSLELGSSPLTRDCQIDIRKLEEVFRVYQYPTNRRVKRIETSC